MNICTTLQSANVWKTQCKNWLEDRWQSSKTLSVRPTFKPHQQKCLQCVVCKGWVTYSATDCFMKCHVPHVLCCLSCFIFSLLRSTLVNDQWSSYFPELRGELSGGHNNEWPYYSCGQQVFAQLCRACTYCTSSNIQFGSSLDATITLSRRAETFQLM